jgi:hypothetical protein
MKGQVPGGSGWGGLPPPGEKGSACIKAIPIKIRCEILFGYKFVMKLADT